MILEVNIYKKQFVLHVQARRICILSTSLQMIAEQKFTQFHASCHRKHYVFCWSDIGTRHRNSLQMLAVVSPRYHNCH